VKNKKGGSGGILGEKNLPGAEKKKRGRGLGGGVEGGGG